jgi:putative FmdB family regulatory protein
MPMYDYVCNNCKKDFTVFLTLKEYESSPQVNCPECKSADVERKIAEFYAKTSSKS